MVYAPRVSRLKKRATIKDVAQLAGVSPTTVSHALNDKGTIAETTKERIQRAAAELGYRPNAVARGLRQSRLGMLALVIRPLDSLDTFQPEGVDFFMRFTGSAALTALQHGFTLMLMNDPTSENAPASSLVADGCIIADPVADDPVITYLHNKRMPLVTVGVDPSRRDAFPSIFNDTRDETLLILNHLEEAGATRVALVTGTDQNDWNIDSDAAYRAWCLERGQVPVVFSFDETLGIDGGRQAMKRIQEDADIDAVYCLTGRHAAGVAQEAIESGIRVPEDLLVAGGSDSVQTRTMSPTITSLDLLPEETAVAAVVRLVHLLNNPNEEHAGATPGPAPKLVIRESTIRPRH